MNTILKLASLLSALVPMNPAIAAGEKEIFTSRVSCQYRHLFDSTHKKISTDPEHLRSSYKTRGKFTALATFILVPSGEIPSSNKYASPRDHDSLRIEFSKMSGKLKVNDDFFGKRSSFKEQADLAPIDLVATNGAYRPLGGDTGVGSFQMGEEDLVFKVISSATGERPGRSGSSWKSSEFLNLKWDRRKFNVALKLGIKKSGTSGRGKLIWSETQELTCK